MAGGPGGIAGGLVIGGFGAGLAAARNPIRRALVMDEVRKTLRQQGRRAARAMDSIEDGLRASEKRFSSQNIMDRVRAPKGSVAAIYLSGNEQERRERFDELAERITELTTNPQLAMASIQEETEGSGDVHPELPAALGLSYMRSLGALQAALPRSRRPSGAGMPGMTVAMSMTAVDDFLQTAAVLEDPFFGVDLAVAGGLSARTRKTMVRDKAIRPTALRSVCLENPD
jgi:hypothetical protein